MAAGVLRNVARRVWERRSGPCHRTWKEKLEAWYWSGRHLVRQPPNRFRYWAAIAGPAPTRNMGWRSGRLPEVSLAADWRRLMQRALVRSRSARFDHTQRRGQTD